MPNEPRRVDLSPDEAEALRRRAIAYYAPIEPRIFRRLFIAGEGVVTEYYIREPAEPR
jgi:hypothetical protein